MQFRIDNVRLSPVVPLTPDFSGLVMLFDVVLGPVTLRDMNMIYSNRRGFSVLEPFRQPGRPARPYSVSRDLRREVKAVAVDLFRQSRPRTLRENSETQQTPA